MKMKLLLAALFAALWTGAFAQQELTPPKFNGADVEYFMRRLVGEFEKVAVERRIPAAEISMRVAVAFKVDSTGGVSEWRFRDNASEGRDRTDLPPASEATRGAMTEAFSHLEGWMPALDAAGRKVDYTLRLTLRLPVEKIVRMQDPDPLLFQGEDPNTNFFEWVRTRVRYDDRFRNVGGDHHRRCRRIARRAPYEGGDPRDPQQPGRMDAPQGSRRTPAHGLPVPLQLHPRKPLTGP